LERHFLMTVSAFRTLVKHDGVSARSYYHY
jgi:hypothetical protein